MIPQPRYKVEFILHVYNISLEAVKSSLVEFSDKIEVYNYSDEQSKGDNFKVVITTLEPALVFDVCSQFGRIRSVKIDEEEL